MAQARPRAQDKLRAFFTVNGILMLVGIIASTILLLLFGSVMIKVLPMLIQQGAMAQLGSFPAGP